MLSNCVLRSLLLHHLRGTQSQRPRPEKQQEHSHKDRVQRSIRNTVTKTASTEASGTQSQRPRPEKHQEHSHKDRVHRSIRWEQLTSKTIRPATRAQLYLPLHTAFLGSVPSLISLMVSVDVKHHVYLLTYLLCHPPQSHTQAAIVCECLRALGAHPAHTAYLKHSCRLNVCLQFGTFILKWNYFRNYSNACVNALGCFSRVRNAIFVQNKMEHLTVLTVEGPVL